VSDDLRDTFAAAALTGLLARPDIDDDPLEYHFLTEHAYKWADAMLAERARHLRNIASEAITEKCDTSAETTLGGGRNVPSSAGGEDCGGNREAEARQTSPPLSCEMPPVTGGSPAATAEPVAWAVVCGESDSLMGFCHTKREAIRFMHALIEATRAERFVLSHVPLYAAPPQDRVVRLPPKENATGPIGHGWNAAIDECRIMLEAAGVRWEYEDATSPTSGPR
jgi:hypothetical protein